MLQLVLSWWSICVVCPVFVMYKIFNILYSKLHLYILTSFFFLIITFKFVIFTVEKKPSPEPERKKEALSEPQAKTVSPEGISLFNVFDMFCLKAKLVSFSKF